MAGVIEQLESQKQHHNRLKNFWLEQAEKRGKNKDRTTPKAIFPKLQKKCIPNCLKLRYQKQPEKLHLRLNEVI